MDNFNIHKYYRDQYLAEDKSINESFDFKKYDKLVDKLKKELKSKIGDYNTSISMRDYSQDRDDSDPLKGKGFGSIDFYYRNDLPQNDFNKAIKFVKDKGFDIESESNYYEIEYDGDRAFFPRIKFNFDISKAEEELNEGTCGYSIDGKPADKPASPDLNENRAQDLANMYSLEDLNDILKRIYGEMEQEAEPEGGPIANQYADEIYQYEEAIRIKKGVGQRGRKDIPYDVAIGRMTQDEYDKMMSTVKPDRDSFEKSSKFDRIKEEEYTLDFGELDEVLKEQGKSDIEIKEIKSKLLKLSESNKVKAQELTEKLCKKGEAYRKRRMAAGEKSSAYLSGRAVKVCKGQISGRKKKK